MSSFSSHSTLQYHGQQLAGDNLRAKSSVHSPVTIPRDTYPWNNLSQVQCLPGGGYECHSPRPWHPMGSVAQLLCHGHSRPGRAVTEPDSQAGSAQPRYTSSIRGTAPLLGLRPYPILAPVDGQHAPKQVYATQDASVPLPQPEVPVATHAAFCEQRSQQIGLQLLTSSQMPRTTTVASHAAQDPFWPVAAASCGAAPPGPAWHTQCHSYPNPWHQPHSRPSQQTPLVCQQPSSSVPVHCDYQHSRGCIMVQEKAQATFPCAAGTSTAQMRPYACHQTTDRVQCNRAPPWSNAAMGARAAMHTTCYESLPHPGRHVQSMSAPLPTCTSCGTCDRSGGRAMPRVASEHQHRYFPDAPKDTQLFPAQGGNLNIPQDTSCPVHRPRQFNQQNHCQMQHLRQVQEKQQDFWEPRSQLDGGFPPFWEVPGASDMAGDIKAITRSLGHVVPWFEEHSEGQGNAMPEKPSQPASLSYVPVEFSSPGLGSF
jgi:hypothetical protein